jgi:predicted RNA binding protein YcfA (HicA-like mRNA interferase family)
VPDGFYREVTAELNRLGFVYWKPAKGSHEKWRSEATGTILIVPNNLKSRHTANAILGDSGSSKRI